MNYMALHKSIRHKKVFPASDCKDLSHQIADDVVLVRPTATALVDCR